MHWILVAAIMLVFFTMVPLAVDLMRFFLPHWRLTRVVGKAAHTFLFATVAGLFCVILYYHHFVFLPLLLNHESAFHSTTGVLHMTFSTWLWLNVLGHYYHTVTMHPGTDPSFCPRKVKFEEAKLLSYGIPIQSSPVVSVGTGSGDNDSDKEHNRHRFTSTSTRGEGVDTNPRTGAEWRPVRSHFCSVCHCAVFYWDHHCPFTGNCIGLRNYSNFLLGLCYGVMGGCYAAAISWPFFLDCNVLPYFRGHSSNDQCAEIGSHSYIFLPVLVGLWLSGCTLLLTVVILLADMSTYEVLKYWDRFPMPRFIFKRICARRYLDRNSRLRVLVLQRREHFLWYLLPIRNTKLAV